jgi:LAO/AO transport system kinase
MRDLASEPGVFIRSMASRGHPGGIAHATRDVVTVLDALGVPVILVETVGAGQAQVDVARVAHTVVLVEAPGMGDDVQALKAGLLEIADIIVVNKADRPEAQQTLRMLRSARIGAQSEPEDDAATAWSVPILETSALEVKGIAELVDRVRAHRDYLKAGRRWEALRTRHARAEVEAWLQRHMQTLLSEYVERGEIEEAVEAAASRERDPASAAKMLIDMLLTRLRA